MKKNTKELNNIIFAVKFFIRDLQKIAFQSEKKLPVREKRHQ